MSCVGSGVPVLGLQVLGWGTSLVQGPQVVHVEAEFCGLEVSDSGSARTEWILDLLMLIIWC